MRKTIYIFGGGTTYPVAGHLALASIAYGGTARKLEALCREHLPNLETKTILTKMADRFSKIETFADLKAAVEQVIEPSTKIVFFSTAVVDFEPRALNGAKYPDGRLMSSEHQRVFLHPNEKLIRKLRGPGGRKDIFVVGFKSTYGLDETQQYHAGHVTDW